LRHRLLAAAPWAICFNSKAALARLSSDDVTPPWSGSDAGRWAAFPDSLVWALHDSSPTASAYRALRLKELQALKRRIDEFEAP
jgi:hypothetical protein